MENFTFRELAHAIEKMSDEQKDMTVLIHIEDETTLRQMESLQFMHEDIYVNTEYPEEAGTLEELKSAYGEDFDIDKFQLSTPKGRPFIYDGN